MFLIIRSEKYLDDRSHIKLKIINILLLLLKLPDTENVNFYNFLIKLKLGPTYFNLSKNYGYSFEQYLHH